MRKKIAILTLFATAASPLAAQPARKEGDVAKQRAAIEAWTTCIADENRDSVAKTLARDFRSRDYRGEMTRLAKTRVSRRCFAAMPGDYRRIELGGLPFAGGLAERLMEQDAAPLAARLQRASAGRTTATFAPSDALAQCVVRAAPRQVADLFESAINSAEETRALGALAPTARGCTSGPRAVEASPLGMRSMLATAAFRLLAAQAD
ncbi:hypothetical protein [Qipengyuania sediminis]|uniref:hypothetical protein n=1 Tax=Qipengyuania sediminis TaxID=1532023 RepID=UPI001059AD23|nr:hypothetical protein [Qipengyuania sediminis]